MKVESYDTTGPIHAGNIYQRFCILKHASVSILTNVGEYSWQEATLVPCHHPKTELLQNILRG